jgi:hypothetical protein
MRIIYYSAENEPSRNKTSSNSTRDHTVQTVVLTDGTVDFPNNRIFTPLHLPFGLKTEAISSLILRSHRCARPGHGGYSKQNQDIDRHKKVRYNTISRKTGGICNENRVIPIAR